jgi:hypothetical protein
MNEMNDSQKFSIKEGNQIIIQWTRVYIQIIIV